jgi:hypothetical protein
MTKNLTLPNPSELADHLGDLKDWSHDCHRAALELVHSGLLPDTARVARGSCPGVFGQHSWAVPYGDCYDREATVIDPTLWSYDDTVNGVYIGLAYERPHLPHGHGSIWQWGKPETHGGDLIELDVEWSREAEDFLRLLGPLDRQGWAHLAHAPVGGWPASEIIGRMYDDKRLTALIPIDIVGMATDRNPSGLYR